MVESTTGVAFAEVGTRAATALPGPATVRRKPDTPGAGGPTLGRDRVDFSDEARQAAGSFDTEERAQVRRLQARDAEVRAHEQAHRQAASGLAVSGARYKYETGPDGRRYAVSGEVQIDTSPGKDPEETIAKAKRIIAAATAPARPSSADRAVAARASAMAARARIELSRESEESSPATLLNVEA